jgi:hypothetical protein
MSPVNLEPMPAVVVRRSGRISKEVPILLSGADADGLQFAEKTRTLILSRHGASVLSGHKLIPEQEAYLRLISSNHEIEVRICGEIGEREDGHIYGVAFADQSVDFWRMEFPPAEPLPKGVIAVTLECSGCHRQILVQFDATEMDVYAVNEGALRYCPQCATSTVWRIATPKPAAPEKAPEPTLEPIPTFIESTVFDTKRATTPVESHTAPHVAAPTQPNRRGERRTKVKFNACIRASGSSEEIVPCEDMSRGGFCFHSSRQYSVEAMIEAAVPYTPGGTSIFVPAQIANVRPLQNGKLYRYGVAYVRSARK